MAEGRVQRRLAAILAADVVGYSRLIRADEEDTLARLKALRSAVIDPPLAAQGGRIVKIMGDGLLVEFASVVDAVRSATEIQQSLTRHNGDVPEDRRIVLRIGINLGDVVIEGDDIYGDGVNVAARLESLAVPSGLCVSGAVHDQVRDRLDLEFEDLGEQVFKNISRPIRVWQWTATAVRAKPPNMQKRSDRTPLLAVLGFESLGDDAALANLGRVLTRNVTTEMSGRTGFKLVAAATIARLEGASEIAIDAARDALGAEFVLCGTVTGNAKRVRVQVELIETKGGSQIWAERYDRGRGDLLSLTDDLTDVIVQASRTATNAFIGSLYDDLPDGALSSAERLARAARYFYRLKPGDEERALEQIDTVLAAEPDHAMALTMRAVALSWKGRFRLTPLPPSRLDEVSDLLERALSLDPRSDFAYWTRGDTALFLKGDVDQALADAERALELNPHYSLGLSLKGQALCYAGRAEEGISLLQRSIEVDRHDPANVWRYCGLATGLFLSGKPAEALSMVDKAIQTRRPFPEFRLVRIALLEEVGRHEDAASELAQLGRQYPAMRLAKIRMPPFAKPDDLRHFTDNLLAAGLPA